MILLIKVGDYVTRNSYNNDIIFKVVDIVENNYFLYGVFIRLSADSPLDDLVKYDGKIDIQYEDSRILFDDEDGKRHQIIGGITIIDEK